MSSTGPSTEIDGTRERSHHDELSEGDAGLERHLHRGIEGCRTVGRQAKDERAEHVHAVAAESLQLAGECLAGVVPVLEDGLES